MKYKLTTTLKLLRKNGACTSGYRKLVKSLPKGWEADKPINLLRVLDSNGVPDTFWCFGATAEDSTIPRTLISAECAESVLKFFTNKYPNNDSPANAIQAARDFAAGKIDKHAVAVAASAAVNAANAACAADAAVNAAYAAYAAVNAAYAADAAANAAYAADAAACAARQKERQKQARIIRKWLKE